VTRAVSSDPKAVTTPEASRHRLLVGDAREVLRALPSASVDLVVTSPPYAEARSGSYGGVSVEDYVGWFLPIAAQLQRVLRPFGTFILNIKEGCQRGERGTYVLELILALRAEGWLWTEEFIWHKKHCYPGKWPNRFRDAWERLLQFNRQRDFRMYQDAVRVPARSSTVARARHLSPRDQLQVVSGSGSGLSRRVASCVRLANADGSERSLVYPSNVLYLAAETRNCRHPAAFPESLPDWFIRLFTKPGDMVLDPFMGSGTTNAVAKRLGQHSIGIDAALEYVHRAAERLSATQAAATPSKRDS
jgi:site-specific DNA-methyltransferase (cytosine-N4-specific)